MVFIDYRSIIWDQRARLTKEMDPVKVVTYLVNCKSITSSDKELIERIHPPSKRTSKLLKMIAVKGPEAYENFVKALEEDECFGVAYYLVRNEMEEWKKGVTCLSDDLEKEQQEHKKTRQKLEEIGNLTQELEILIRELEDAMNTTPEEGKVAQSFKDTAGENDHQQRVSSKHIQAIVDHIEPITMDLGACLGVPTPEFLNIEEENDSNRQKIWKVLIKWKQRKGKGATLGILIDVLYKLNQTEAADKLLGNEEIKTEERKEEQTQSGVPQENTALRNEELRTAKRKQEQVKVKELQVNTVQGNKAVKSSKKEANTVTNVKQKVTVSGNEESKTAKREEEKTQVKVQQVNMVPGNEEFKSGKKKEAKAVTKVQQKMTASGKHRTGEDLRTCRQDPRGKLKPLKPHRPIDFDYRAPYVKAKEMLFTWNGKEKDAPTFKVPVTAHPKDGKGNIGKKKSFQPSSKILSEEEEEENTAKNMDFKESKGKQQDSKGY